MEGIVNKACGLDIHKQFFIATILSRYDEKQQLHLNRDAEGIITLKNLVLSEKCGVVACESTNDFWVPIYDLLIKHVNVIVGNARDMKAFTHKKTDKIDSEFIAKLALNEMIQPSRVFSKEHRDFRSLVRLRHKFVQKRTDIKNVAHAILASEMFRLNDVLTDIFGKNEHDILRITGTKNESTFCPTFFTIDYIITLGRKVVFILALEAVKKLTSELPIEGTSVTLITDAKLAFKAITLPIKNMG